MAERFVQSHIRNLPLFQQLTPAQIGVLASIVQVLRFDAGQLVIQEGQPTPGLFLFVSGRGILTRHAPNGVDETVGTIAAGQYLDEEALYASGVETVSMRVTETAIVLLIPRAPFVQLITQYPEIRANVRVQTSAAQPRETGVHLFKGQRPDETVLQVWRRHWWAVARHGWIALLAAIVMFAVALLLAGRAPALALGAAGLAVVIPGIIVAYLYNDWQDDSVVLTDQRIVRVWHRAIAFETTISEMPLDQVLEVNTVIPPGDPFARLFQYGTVTVKTAGEGVNMGLEMMPHPTGVQSMIFQQRDLFRERLEQHQREFVRTDIQEALGMGMIQSGQPSAPQPKSDQPTTIGVPFVRTKFMSSNGDVIYRKHSSIWVQHVFFPTLLIIGSVLVMLVSLMVPTLPFSGGIGLAGGMFLLIFGILWFYATDWDWRNDLFIIGNETITLIRKRPFWLQNQVERIRIAQIDNVKSEVNGLLDNLINRGNVRISLIGSDIKDAKVMELDLRPAGSAGGNFAAAGGAQIRAAAERRRAAAAGDQGILADLPRDSADSAGGAGAHRLHAAGTAERDAGAAAHQPRRHPTAPGPARAFGVTFEGQLRYNRPHY